LKVKKDKANEHHKSIIEALKVASVDWTFKQINFVADRRGTVVKDDFYKSSKGVAYKQERGTGFWQRMCNAYAKRMIK